MDVVPTCVLCFCSDGSYVGLVNGFMSMVLPLILYVALFVGGYLSGGSVHVCSLTFRVWTRSAVRWFYLSVAMCIGLAGLVTWALLAWIVSPTPFPELGCGFAHGFPAPGAVAISLLAALILMTVFDLALLVRWPWLLTFLTLLMLFWNAWALIYTGANFAWQVLAGDVLGILLGVLWHVFVTRPLLRNRIMRVGK